MVPFVVFWKGCFLLFILTTLAVNIFNAMKRYREAHYSGLWVVRPSRRKSKKWMATHADTDTTVHFGHPDYEDYTQHKDPERRMDYISRHRKNEDWQDLGSAGAWARHLLWAKKDMHESAEAMENKFGINIRLVGRSRRARP